MPVYWNSLRRTGFRRYYHIMSGRGLDDTYYAVAQSDTPDLECR